MKKEYLPIGSVVLLKNAKKRVMVTGFYVKEEEKSDKVYDYVGVMYPEGVIQSDKNLVFNNDQIEKVYFSGFSDIEEQEFKQKLYKLIEKEETKTKEKIEQEDTMEIPFLEL